jgi:hypothetical protein
MAGVLTYVRSNMFTAANGARPSPVQRVAVMVANGNSIDPAATQAAADEARRAGIWIISVAVGNWLDIDELRGIASYTASLNVVTVTDFNSFSTVVDVISDTVCGSEFR